MPRSKEGIKRVKLDPGNMESAVQAVLDPKQPMPYREACKTFGVKLTTLHRQVNNCKVNGNSETFTYTANHDHKKVFSIQEEEDLVQYCITIARMQYGLSKKRMRELAYKFAIAKNKNVPPKWHEKEIAGVEWLRSFRQRHGDRISLRQPEATSLSRATSFNRTNVNRFFENLDAVFKRYGVIPPENIYNEDETGLTTVQNPQKILAPKGEKQVGSVSSAERGQLVTFIAAINAVGNSIPPCLVFPRVHFKPHMLLGAPNGSIGKANPSGWSNEKIFLEYLDHFIQHSRASTENRVLLILDNHESHMSVDVINKARNSGIILLTLPPHTSNRMQPLDLTVFGPLKTYYSHEMDLWMRNNPGQTFTIYNIAGALGEAFPRAFTHANITNGFKASGIYPNNPDVFPDHYFLCSEVTNRPPPPPVAAPSSSPENAPITPQLENSDENSKKVVTPEDVVPYPKAKERKNCRKGRKLGCTKILTLTPDKIATVVNPNVTPEKIANVANPNIVEKLPKKMPIKKRKNVPPVEHENEDSSSSSDFSTHETDESVETFSDLEPEKEKIEILDSDLIKDRFVVVKLKYNSNTKKEHIKYFVAQITETITGDVVTCEFLKKANHNVGNSFVHRNVPDIMKINKEAVEEVLPTPAHKRGHYTFYNLNYDCE